MATTTTAKSYEATFRPKAIPADIKKEIVDTVTEQYDKFTESFPTSEFNDNRIINRERNIANKIQSAEWLWLYEKETKHTITAENKSEATKLARLQAKELGLAFIYVYYAPQKKEG